MRDLKKRFVRLVFRNEPVEGLALRGERLRAAFAR
jgi:hypothetical protein